MSTAGGRGSREGQVHPAQHRAEAKSNKQNRRSNEELGGEKRAETPTLNMNKLETHQYTKQHNFPFQVIYLVE